MVELLKLLIICGSFYGVVMLVEEEFRIWNLRQIHKFIFPITFLFTRGIYREILISMKNDAKYWMVKYNTNGRKELIYINECNDVKITVGWRRCDIKTGEYTIDNSLMRFSYSVLKYSLLNERIKFERKFYREKADAAKKTLEEFKLKTPEKDPEDFI